MPGPNSEAKGAIGAGGEEPDGGRDEFALIDLLQQRFEAGHGGLTTPGDLGIGDDAAAVTMPDSGRVVLATDLVVAGVHVDLGLSSPEDVGWKALAVTVSDLAAMGARPAYALLSIAAPAGFPVVRLGAGTAEAADVFGCAVVGGDLSASPVLVVSVVVVGSLPDAGFPLLRRDGARPGNHLYVTGPLGASAAGLRLLASERNHPGSEAGADATSYLASAHLRPVARLAEGTAARRTGATSAIDVSDGLVADAVHLAEASHVGLALEVGADVVAVGATRDEALHGGEDYELVVATDDPAKLMAAFRRAGLRTPIAVGRCTSDPAERSLDGGPLPAWGWRHRF